MDNPQLNNAFAYLGKKIDDLNSSIKDALRSVEREIPDTSKIDTKLDKVITTLQVENTEELQKSIDTLKTSLVEAQTSTIQSIAEQQKVLSGILTTLQDNDSNVVESLDSISKQLSANNSILEALNKIVVKLSQIKPKDSSDKIIKGLEDVVSAVNAFSIDFPTVDLTGLNTINDSIKSLQQDIKKFNTKVIEDKLTELINATGGAKITVSGTPPQNPTLGQLWLDTS